MLLSGGHCWGIVEMTVWLREDVIEQDILMLELVHRAADSECCSSCWNIVYELRNASQTESPFSVVLHSYR
jgi:hypothetical protein